MLKGVQALGSECHSSTAGQGGDQAPDPGGQGAAGLAARCQVFAKHIANQQLTNEFPVELGIESLIPGVEYRLQHVLEPDHGVVKEAVKKAECKVRRYDEQLSCLRVF